MGLMGTLQNCFFMYILYVGCWVESLVSFLERICLLEKAEEENVACACVMKSAGSGGVCKKLRVCLEIYSCANKAILKHAAHATSCP